MTAMWWFMTASTALCGAQTLPANDVGNYDDKLGDDVGTMLLMTW